MEMRPFQNGDLRFISGLIPPSWQGVIEAFDFYTNSDFCFPVKVLIDKKIVGIGSTIIHNDTAWLAHIIVHPGYRNQGIGRIITQTLVESATSKHCETLYLLATASGESVYKKIGFETETEYVIFKGDKPIEVDGKHENILAYNSDFKNDIVNLDRRISGEDRAFQLEPHLPNGFVYLDDNEIKGFYLATFGDGVILATTKTAGIELMKLRMTSKDFAVFPIDNETATDFIHQNNFKELRRQKRMRLGKRRDWQPEHIYNRIGGNLG